MEMERRESRKWEGGRKGIKRAPGEWTSLNPDFDSPDYDKPDFDGPNYDGPDCIWELVKLWTRPSLQDCFITDIAAFHSDENVS
jgi:hypothetical protein